MPEALATAMVPCRAHPDVMVGVDADGHLVGRCPRCIAEAANAIRQIDDKPTLALVGGKGER